MHWLNARYIAIDIYRLTGIPWLPVIAQDLKYGSLHHRWLGWIPQGKAFIIHLPKLRYYFNTN